MEERKGHSGLMNNKTMSSMSVVKMSPVDYVHTIYDG